jgi:hypothetical protein
MFLHRCVLLLLIFFSSIVPLNNILYSLLLATLPTIVFNNRFSSAPPHHDLHLTSLQYSHPLRVCWRACCSHLLCIIFCRHVTATRTTSSPRCRFGHSHSGCLFPPTPICVVPRQYYSRIFLTTDRPLVISKHGLCICTLLIRTYHLHTFSSHSPISNTH